ncbi:alpha/beta fold hydrolase [Ottowia sp.]|uniref:alpha/beta fold hydrolase n=1 Tax=Ottowia sp. TaxID=1898956 RepID=UPI002CF4294E|nr:alpha/beta fold hydrolase [Ottowia sp.]HOB66858.1 alpha/beta fold hydrolase [Ottowia sp.]HPZ56733.1 alpha/beta fold hydrolase [Ottowia sp.]HQD48446.1 alpha/beta fold hydrolase [Ottowia sp.]
MNPIAVDPSPDVPFMLSITERSRLAAGRRLRTGGAQGHIVWHAWEPSAPTDAPPLVLFHGGSGSWTHWVRNIVPLVDSGRRVFAVDLPGFGDSDPPAGGSDADAMLAPLAHSMAQLFAGQPVDLVGFSFGGMTAGMLLADHPALARRLVLVGAPAMGVVPARQFELKGWRHLKTPQEQAEIHRHNLGVLMLHDHDLIDGLALEVHIANVQRDRLPRRRLAHTDILARSLPRVPCPVRAIYGAHDVLYRQYIHQLAQRFAETAPDFRGMALIEGAGHWVQFEAPEAFDAALLRALSDD